MKIEVSGKSRLTLFFLSSWMMVSLSLDDQNYRTWFFNRRHSTLPNFQQEKKVITVPLRHLVQLPFISCLFENFNQFLNFFNEFCSVDGCVVKTIWKISHTCDYILSLSLMHLHICSYIHTHMLCTDVLTGMWNFHMCTSY